MKAAKIKVGHVLLHLKSATKFDVRAIVVEANKKIMIEIQLKGIDDKDWVRADDGSCEIELYTLKNANDACRVACSVMQMHFDFEDDAESLDVLTALDD